MKASRGEVALVESDVFATTSIASPPAAVSRRGLMRRGLGHAVAALGGAAAASVAGARPVGAANGQAVIQGATNSASAPTIVNNNATGAYHRSIEGAMSAAAPGSGSAGVRGVNRGPNASYGVLGEHFGADGIGVVGRSAGITGVSGSGRSVGVYGTSGSYGVFGSAPTGVYGSGTGSESTGVSGDATYGVVGYGDTTGVYGNGPNGVVATGTAAGAAAVHATNNQSGGKGVFGNGYIGVQGNGTSYGVLAYGTAAGAVGVYGSATYGVYAVGSEAGVRAIASGATAHGVLATAQRYAVYASSSGSPGGAIGVLAYGPSSNGGIGVQGNGLIGVYGTSNDVGVRGNATNTGVYGQGAYSGVSGATTVANGVGVRADNTASGGLGLTARGFYQAQGNTGGAAYFNGRVWVDGDVIEYGGGMRMDHPLQPADRFLQHSAVHAPEMLNVYGGSIELDGAGRATVRLPRYFEALNSDHRIQLTAVGAPAPGLHVAREVAQGRFAIAGGARGQKVFWQVTGVRRDAWASKHPLRVELRKPSSQRGRYLAPELFGKRKSEAIGYQKGPRMRKAPPVPARVARPERVPAPRPPQEPQLPSPRRARVPRPAMP